ncbi:MAG TPA: ABC transporter ATP-binding protein, partial [Nocardioidaceae bacterium]|nr:ABC transporter ATP-binding protein [Nocardioidaceae bacterium]
MSMGHGMGPVWRHMRTDRSIGEQKLQGDTVRRVLGFARPHRRPIGVFLGLTVVDAALVVVTPLLVKRIVDDGILKQDTRLVVMLALAAAGVALLDAGLALAMGWLSSRIGEGLIFDLR